MCAVQRVQRVRENRKKGKSHLYESFIKPFMFVCLCAHRGQPPTLARSVAVLGLPEDTLFIWLTEHGCTQQHKSTKAAILL